MGRRLMLVLCLLAAGAGAHAADTLRVGSKRFTESYILAEIVAQTAAPHLPSPPQLRQGLGNTAVVFEALKNGAIDVYPEYTGTIAEEILRDPSLKTLPALNAALAKHGLAVAVPLGFNDGYALAMRADRAKALGVATLADLARHPELKLGLSNEFIGRADGWRGLAQRYRLPQRPTGIDHGLAYGALQGGQVDVVDIYSTDAQIARLGLTVLRDDAGYFPRYDAVLLHRLDVPTRFPAAWAALQKLQGSISEAQMIALNAGAEVNGQAFDALARAHLGGASAPAAAGASTFWSRLTGADLGRLTLQHLMLVLVSVGAATLLAVPAALLVHPHPRLRALVLGATGILQTIPALALLAVLISAMGAIGTGPALVALTLYALLPIMRNTTAGLAGVPAGLQQAALGLGLTPAQRMRWLLLPLALPTALAGVRTATAITVGTATIAAFIGAGGYGERIVTGLALNDSALLLAGALPASLLALAGEALFEAAERLLQRRRSG